MFQQDAVTGRIVDYLKSNGGSTSKNSRAIANAIGASLYTTRDAIYRLQQYGVVTQRDEDNCIKLTEK